MEENSSGGFRDVKQILTVREASGKVSQIYTLTRRTSTSRPIVSPVGNIRPANAYSLLKRDSPVPAKSRNTPSILRKSLKRKFTAVREPCGRTSNAVLEFPGGGQRSDPSPNAPHSHEINETGAEGPHTTNHVRTPTHVRNPRRPSMRELLSRARELQDPAIGIRNPVVPPARCLEPMNRRIIVRRNVSLLNNRHGERSTSNLTPETPPREGISPEITQPNEKMPRLSAEPQSMTTALVPEVSVDVNSMRTEAPDEFIVDNYDPPSNPTETATSNIESPTETGPPGEPFTLGNSMLDVSDPGETVDDVIDHISKNAASHSEKFYMVSHEKLMEVLSTCNICASVADVTLRRNGTTCEAAIKCRVNEMHDSFWDGEERSLGGESRAQERNGQNSRLPPPSHRIPRSLITMSLVARVVDIPLKQLQRFCRLLFATDDIGLKLEAASSVTSSFQLIHSFARPKLEKPMDHLKLIVVCRELLVFLDPFSYSPLACFRSRGAKLWSTSHLSSALNIGLQRLQLLNSNKFSRVDVVHSSSNAEDPGEWKPMLVPDMDLMYQEALACLHIALWQNKYEFDIKSSQLRGILEDITKALCFFQPEVARMSDCEARSHYSLVLSDLSKMHDRQHVPRLDEIALLRRTFESLSRSENGTQIEALVAEVERLDFYNTLTPLYEKMISTADASYVVSIRNEEPCRATNKAMKMIEICQDEELSLENALRVLMLLPHRGSPFDLMGDVLGYV